MDQYNEGLKAAQEHLQFWFNPYAHPSGNQVHFQAWFAGWCYGRSQMVIF